MAKRRPAADPAIARETESVLTARGAVPATTDLTVLYVLPVRYAFTLGTPVGPLHATPDGAWVFCRFEDPKRARAGGVDCNPYTGKWNHFYTEPAAEAAALFAGALDRVLRLEAAPNG